MVEALVDLAEGAFADALDDFEAVGEVVVDLAFVLLLVVVESEVFGPLGGFRSAVLSGEEIDVVDGVVFEDFLLFVLY